MSGKNNLVVLFPSLIVQDRWLCLPELPSSLVFKVFFSRQLGSVYGECLLVGAAGNCKEQATRGYCNLSSMKTPLAKSPEWP